MKIVIEKPPEFQAFQFTGEPENAQEIMAWLGAVSLCLPAWTGWSGNETTGREPTKGMILISKDLTAQVGSWIIIGPEGNPQVMDERTFAQSYIPKEVSV